MQRAVIATGFGDIRLVAPAEAFEPLILKSTLGNIHVLVPTGVNARVTVSARRTIFHVHVDDRRYTRDEDTAPITPAKVTVRWLTSTSAARSGTLTLHEYPMPHF